MLWRAFANTVGYAPNPWSAPLSHPAGVSRAASALLTPAKHMNEMATMNKITSTLLQSIMEREFRDRWCYMYEFCVVSWDTMLLQWRGIYTCTRDGGGCNVFGSSLMWPHVKSRWGILGPDQTFLISCWPSNEKWSEQITAKGTPNMTLFNFLRFDVWILEFDCCNWFVNCWEMLMLELLSGRIRTNKIRNLWLIYIASSARVFSYSSSW